MTVTVKNSAVGLVVPPSVRRRTGIKAGDRLEFKVSGGIINIIPKLPSADDEYTPAQRRVIDAQLKEAAKGPYYGPLRQQTLPSNSSAQRSARERLGNPKQPNDEGCLVRTCH
jgi:bifunctional DNA-binding transcriptional regulator/antitoxin component of YhaV-PrlF toxin-antitoxin module